MKVKNMIKHFLILIVLVGLVFVGACKKSEEADNNDYAAQREPIEKAAGYTAAAIVNLGTSIYTNAIAIITGGSETETSEETNLALSFFSYDPATGWWLFSLTLDNNQSANVRVRFLDESGDFFKYFGLNTYKIETTGDGAGNEGSFTWDLEITGIGLTSSAFVINGSGTTNYQGTTTSYVVDDMTINKLEDGIPETGTLVLGMSGVQITVTFNGSQLVQVTYEYRGRSYTFTINLETGEIT